MTNVVSNTRINWSTLGQTHLLLYSNNLLLLLRVPGGIHTVDGLPIEVETIPVGMNKLTQTYTSVAC